VNITVVSLKLGFSIHLYR